jgi:hypothetical protein
MTITSADEQTVRRFYAAQGHYSDQYALDAFWKAR